MEKINIFYFFLHGWHPALAGQAVRGSSVSVKIKASLLIVVILCSRANASDVLKNTATHYGFIENKGQIIDQNNELNPSVLFLYNGNGLHVQLKQKGFSYEVIKIESKPKIKNEINMPSKFMQDSVDYNFYVHRIDISFVNVNPQAKIIASDAAPDYVNYYTVGTTEKGVTNVHHYKKVLYQNIYNNIDVEFILNPLSASSVGLTFKYNFIIHPGGSVNDIQLKFDGANSTSLTSDAHITIETAYGNIDESIPLSYNLKENNIQQKITSNFKLVPELVEGQTSNTYGISVGKYDVTQTLIIDPFPTTYFGGTSIEYGFTITTDKSRNIIACGTTASASSIATSGAYQTYCAGNGDIFIAKFNSSGSIQWSTYYGGANYEGIGKVATDGMNNIFISGMTGSSTNIASAGAYQVSFMSSSPGYPDCFIAKFDSMGTLQWGTYFGGSAFDIAYSIAVDRSSNLLIGGYTSSSSGIATTGAYQTTYAGGGYDAFIAMFNSSGTALLWATYYGGSGQDQGMSIASDQNKNSYIGGYTSSTTSIASSGAFQTVYGGGTFDAFIVKFDSSGNRQWATYYGADQIDQALAIGLDKNGNVLVTGKTTSGSGIASGGAFRTVYGGATDAFVLKFSPSGTRLWATYYGGGNDDEGNCIVADTNQNVFVIGLTSSADSISSPGAYQVIYGGGAFDAFIVKFSSTGARQYCTYFGDSASDRGYGIAIEWNGNIITEGCTSSPTGIASAGAYQISYGGGYADAYIAEFSNGTGYLLPVQLVLFDARLQDKNNVLCTWQTACEINNDRFEIERSLGNSQQSFVNGQWTFIGKVKGHGTTNSLSNYQFIDEMLKQVQHDVTVYYRLKQVDFDGKFEYSKIVSVEFNQAKIPELTIYPNPNSGEFEIKITSLSTPTTLEIFDVIGNKVHEKILSATTSQLHLNNLNKGIYFLRCETSEGVINKKIIIN